jgi:hypothetical protein
MGITVQHSPRPSTVMNLAYGAGQAQYNEQLRREQQAMAEQQAQQQAAMQQEMFRQAALAQREDLRFQADTRRQMDLEKLRQQGQADRDQMAFARDDARFNATLTRDAEGRVWEAQNTWMGMDAQLPEMGRIPENIANKLRELDGQYSAIMNHPYTNANDKQYALQALLPQKRDQVRQAQAHAQPDINERLLNDIGFHPALPGVPLAYNRNGQPVPVVGKQSAGQSGVGGQIDRREMMAQLRKLEDDKEAWIDRQVKKLEIEPTFEAPDGEGKNRQFPNYEYQEAVDQIRARADQRFAEMADIQTQLNGAQPEPQQQAQEQPMPQQQQEAPQPWNMFEQQPWNMFKRQPMAMPDQQPPPAPTAVSPAAKMLQQDQQAQMSLAEQIILNSEHASPEDLSNAYGILESLKQQVQGIPVQDVLQDQQQREQREQQAQMLARDNQAVKDAENLVKLTERYLSGDISSQKFDTTRKMMEYNQVKRQRDQEWQQPGKGNNEQEKHLKSRKQSAWRVCGRP